MRVLVISLEGDGIGIAHKMAREGHNVEVFIKDERFKLAGDGIFKRVSSWRPRVEDCDLVVVDMVGMGHLEQTLSRMGKPFLGASRFADAIELDRRAGMDLLEQADVNRPPTFFYNSPSDAKQLVSYFEDPDIEGLVVKPHNNQATADTRVVRSAEMYLWLLDQMPEDTKLTIQEYVDGVEVSCEGWFNGRDWVRPFNITFEEKRFMDGDRGPNTGCMGNVVMAVKDVKLVQETVMKLTPMLKAEGYRGPIDINSIVNERGVHALEITARFGYDAIEALSEGLKEDLFDLLFETALGVKKTMDVTRDYMIAIRVSVPPYPHKSEADWGEGLPLNGISDQNLDHLYLTDVFFDDSGYHYAQGDGVVLKATARGRTVQEARHRAYRTINNLDIPDAQYRRDIGRRVDEDLKRLSYWGFI